MPIMKELEVDDVVYTTVGEASVTQVVSTGTKIATIAIDGTSTDLYAPSGGSSVDPATATPLMDGTAAVGTATKYAREDHVHPVDTSRQATLVSGTNIKTINSTSLLGSGNISIAGLPSVSASDNGKVLTVVSGAWSPAEAGGGGGNVIVFYVQSLTGNNTLYVDSALTTTAMEFYDYDLATAWSAVSAATAIKIMSGYGTHDEHIAWVTEVEYDKPEDAIDLSYNEGYNGTRHTTSIS